MRKILALILISIFLFSLSASADELKIRSDSAVLIEATTGQVLYEKNKNLKLSASTLTDIAFMSVIADNLTLSQSVTASGKAVSSFPSDVSNIAAYEGEIFKVEDLLNAVRLVSAEDAKNMLKEAVSDEDFINLLNEKTESVGAANTDFENNETTAFDTALILKDALSNQSFLKTFSNENYEIASTNKYKKERALKEANMFFSSEDAEKLGIVGIKTGYTPEVGNVAAIYADNGERAVIAVILGADILNDVIVDLTTLLDYGFGSFNKLYLKANDVPAFTEDLVTYSAAEDVAFLIKNDVTKDLLKYSYSDKGIEVSDPDGKVLTTIKVKLDEEVPVYIIITRVVLFTLIALLTLIVVFIVSGIVKHNKKKKERQAKLKKIMRENLKEQENKTEKLEV